MDAIISWLLANYPIVALLIAVAFVAWRLKGYLDKLSNHLDKLDTRIENQPYKQHETQYDKLSGKIDELGTNISLIMGYLSSKSGKAANLFSIKCSLRKLNEAGDNLYKDFGGELFLKSNETFLLDAIAAKAPKTALDVEVAASEVLFENLQNDIFNGLKNWVYNSPTRKIRVNGQEQDYTVTMNDVCFILSIPLRDMYLKAHPEVA